MCLKTYNFEKSILGEDSNEGKQKHKGLGPKCWSNLTLIKSFAEQENDLAIISG